MAPCKRVGCALFGSDATNGYCSMCQKARLQTTAATTMLATATTTTAIIPEATNSINQTVVGETVGPTVAVHVPPRNAAEPTEERRGDEKNLTSGGEQPDGSSFPEQQEAFNADAIVDDMAEGHSASQKRVDGALRCYSCTKRLSFTAWPCKCGQVFCPSHGHYKNHSCPFDYKASGKAEIAKANPIVNGSKVKKI